MCEMCRFVCVFIHVFVIDNYWWFWTLIGGAAAAVVVGGVVGSVLSKPTDPFIDIPLGNQRTLVPQ